MGKHPLKAESSGVSLCTHLVFWLHCWKQISTHKVHATILAVLNTSLYVRGLCPLLGTPSTCNHQDPDNTEINGTWKVDMHRQRDIFSSDMMTDCAKYVRGNHFSYNQTVACFKACPNAFFCILWPACTYMWANMLQTMWWCCKNTSGCFGVI